MITKPVMRTGRGKNASRPSRSKEREDTRVTGYPSGHVLSVQNTCLVDKRGTQHISQVENAMKGFDCAEIGETVEEHLIPRKSITKREHLKLFPAKSIEVIDLRVRIAAKDDKGNVVLQDGKPIAYDEAVVRKAITRSDNTLLQKGNPFKSLEEDKKIGRQTSRSKRFITDKSTYKNYLGEVDTRKPETVPSLTLDSNDPILDDSKLFK